ncbi:MAG: HIT family protein [Sandaracinaceae bacterium]
MTRSESPLAATPHAVATFTPYPVRWGHGLVTLRRHVVRLSEVTATEWADAAELARQFGCALSGVLDPARVYVAALGTDLDDLPMSFRHLHLHVLPVPESGARPREVLTWAHGVYVGTAGEWATLRQATLQAWTTVLEGPDTT